MISSVYHVLKYNENKIAFFLQKNVCWQKLSNLASLLKQLKIICFFLDFC